MDKITNSEVGPPSRGKKLFRVPMVWIINLMWSGVSLVVWIFDVVWNGAPMPSRTARARVQLSASELASDERTRTSLVSREIEVAGVVVRINRDGAGVHVLLGNHDGGTALVQVTCASQGAAEVGYHAVIRGEVRSTNRGEMPGLIGGVVVKASR